MTDTEFPSLGQVTDNESNRSWQLPNFYFFFYIRALTRFVRFIRCT